MTNESEVSLKVTSLLIPPPQSLRCCSIDDPYLIYHRMFRTLPRQLFMYLVPGMLLVLAVAAWYLDNLVDDQLTRYFDTSLDVKARSIVALTELDEDGVELEVYPIALPEYFRESEPDYFHMIDSVGETLFSSPSVKGKADTLPNYQSENNTSVPTALIGLQSTEPTLHYFDHALPDGRPGRWVAVSYFPRVDPDDDEASSSELLNRVTVDTAALSTGEPVMVNGVLVTPSRVTTYVGTTRSELDDLLWSIDLILVLTGVAVAAGIILIAGLGIRRAIAPLARLGSDIASVDEKSLDSHISLSRPVAELDVVVDHFNQLLGRLRTAFNRERQFSADVAHELRTPIAEMRNLIEVQQRFPNNESITASYSNDLLESTEHMQHIVEHLLAISSADFGAIDIGGPIDLAELINKQCANYREKLISQGRAIEFTHEATSLITPGSLVWPQIITNLFDNAVDHATGEGPILVNLSTDKDSFLVSISNPTTKLRKSDIELMFGRLWTKDTSRTDSKHNGLGLTLVAAYANSLDVRIQPTLTSIQGAHGKLARIEIELRGDIETSDK